MFLEKKIQIFVSISADMLKNKLATLGIAVTE